ncbi:Uncharacterised protein [Bacillus subtilis]|nr:Uncharacterised protein [Bacillus subtilis]
MSCRQSMMKTIPTCWRKAFSKYLKLLLNKRCRSPAAGKWLASFYSLKTAAPARLKKTGSAPVFLLFDKISNVFRNKFRPFFRHQMSGLAK